jgi:hypothetical protein
MGKKSEAGRDLRGSRGKSKAAGRDSSKDQGQAKTQGDRFIEAAREVGVDESGKEFEAALKRVLSSKRS